jgi:ATP-dependent Clp protease ATP-binding subunit ClpA
MFERFTDQARAVVVGAQEQARRLGHNYIGCEHLLLALVSGGSEIAADLRARGITAERVEPAVAAIVGRGRFDALDREALASIGIDLDTVRQKVESAFGPGALRTQTRRPRGRLGRRFGRRGRCETTPGRSGHIPFTPRAKKALELSLRQSLSLGCREIRPEHLALALTSMRDGTVPRILAALGIAPARLHTEIADRYRQAG